MPKLYELDVLGALNELAPLEGEMLKPELVLPEFELDGEMV